MYSIHCFPQSTSLAFDRRPQSLSCVIRPAGNIGSDTGLKEGDDTLVNSFGKLLGIIGPDALQLVVSHGLKTYDC